MIVQWVYLRRSRRLGKSWVEAMILRTLLKCFLVTTVLLVLASPSWAGFPAISFLPVVGGFTHPVFITNGADGTGRLFVVEQGGIIWIINNSSVLSEGRSKSEAGGGGKL